MLFDLLPVNPTRPSILDQNKDIQYHCDFARYCVGQANNSQHQAWLAKIYLNKRFYKGDQWVDQEDIDSFLKDTDNQDRNRLSIVQNIIRPMVNSYRGNAIRMNINYAVKSISPQVVNRRETELAKMLHLTDVVTNGDNPFKGDMQKKLPIGNSPGETITQFNNTYVDQYVKKMNNLAKFVSSRNKFVNKQVSLAMNLSFAGAAVMNYFEYAGHQEFRVVPSETFFFDRSAKEEDLTDATFMGEQMDLFPTEIFEMFDEVKPEDKKAIEQYSKYFSNLGGGASVNQAGTVTTDGRVPIFKVYWRDGDREEYGYVKDEYGYSYLTRINYTYEGEQEPRYTTKNLIKAESDRAKKLYKRWGGKLSGKIHYDTLRMAIIIPKEIIGACEPDSSDKDKFNDIVLDWGVVPYQETEVIEYQSVKFPYKIGTWAYIDGELTTPIDDALDPQRFINRVWSMAENQLNNAPGSSVFIDSDLLGGTDKGEVGRNMNQSQPVFLSGKGRGMQNAMSPYNGTQNINTSMGMFKIIEAMKASTKETTGLNDALQGNQVGSGNDQLVGVTQMMIERGSLLQEPFYNAITWVFEQCFESIVSVGKRIYIDNEDHLAVAVGDDGVELLKLSKDMNAETFRCFVKRENSDEILIQAANQQLLLFKQLGMLDDKRISKLWGRSNPEEVANELREYSKEKQEIQRMSQQQQAQQEQQLTAQAKGEQQQQQQMVQQQQQREDIKYAVDKKTELDKELIKGLVKIAPTNRKAEKMVVSAGKNLQSQGI